MNRAAVGKVPVHSARRNQTRSARPGCPKAFAPCLAPKTRTARAQGEEAEYG